MTLQPSDGSRAKELRREVPSRQDPGFRRGRWGSEGYPGRLDSGLLTGSEGIYQDLQSTQSNGLYFKMKGFWAIILGYFEGLRREAYG